MSIKSMSGLRSLTNYAEQNPILILTGIVIVLSIIGVSLSLYNQHQAYIAARKAQCDQMASTRDAALTAKGHLTLNGGVVYEDDHFYISDTDTCAFETDQMSLDSDKQMASMFNVTDLFSGRGLMTMTPVLMNNWFKEGTSSAETLAATCRSINVSLQTYFAHEQDSGLGGVLCAPEDAQALGFYVDYLQKHPY